MKYYVLECCSRNLCSSAPHNLVEATLIKSSHSNRLTKLQPSEIQSTKPEQCPS